VKPLFLIQGAMILSDHEALRAAGQYFIPAKGQTESSTFQVGGIKPALLKVT